MILLALMGFELGSVSGPKDTVEVTATRPRESAFFDFPEMLKGAGDYPGAAREFMRLGQTAEAGVCFLLAGDTNACLRLLEKSQDQAGIRLRASVFLAQKKMVQALDQIDDLDPSPTKDSLLVYANLMLMDFEAAIRAAGQDTDLVKAVDYARQTAPLLYDPDAARKLSWVPGAGQLYADEPVQALKAAGINTLSITSVAYAISKHHWVDALLLYGFLFSRFYTGASANAVFICKRKNQLLLDQWLEDIRTNTGLNPFYWESP